MKRCLLLVLCLSFFHSLFAQVYRQNHYQPSNYEGNFQNFSSASIDDESVNVFVKAGEEIPNKLWGFKKLKTLKIAAIRQPCCTKVGSIASELNQLSNLEVLFINSIGVENFPSDLSNLKNLKLFSYKEYQSQKAILQSIPNFSRNISLEVLILGLNKKAKVASFKNFSTIFSLVGLKNLTLTKTMLKAQDLDSLKNFKELEIVKLDGNELTEVPNVFLNGSLQILSLRDNQINVIGSEIKNLTKLKLLDLAYNKLSNLPDEIGSLKNLKELELNYNQLEDLPMTMKNLDSLDVVYLRGNNFTKIPEVLYQMKHLKEIDLMETKITTIDSEILNSNIEILRISSTKVSAFNFDPDMLAKLKSLKKLQISGFKAEKALLKSKKKLKKMRPDISF